MPYSHSDLGKIFPEVNFVTVENEVVRAKVHEVTASLVEVREKGSGRSTWFRPEVVLQAVNGEGMLYESDKL